MDQSALTTNEDICILQSSREMNEHTLTIGECYSDNWREDLSQALKKGEWETIEGMIRENPIRAFKAKLNDNGDTLLLSAFNEGKKELIERLVGKIITPDLLAETDNFGNTALHLAANVGVVEDAKILVKKCPELLNYSNDDGLLPIQLAMRREQGNTHIITSYLLRRMKEESRSNLLNEAAGAGAGARVMRSLIEARFYDLALDLLEFNNKLAWEEENISPLKLMASDPGGFRSGYPFTGWQHIIYSYVSTNQNGRTEHSQGWFPVYTVIWNQLAKVLVLDEDTPGLKLKHHQALQLVKTLCSNIKKMEKAQEKLGEPLLLGAQYGIEEIVGEILESLPTAITYVNEEKHSIYHVAVMYRRENILRMAHEKNKNRNATYYLNPDVNEDNILHLVGYKPREARLDTGCEAIFKMQSEFQWFKKVTDLVTLRESTSKNKKEMIPFALFKKEHADMDDKEIKWMSALASASSVAATLVATVAFAAIFQVPGGNGTCGVPNFSKTSPFRVFVISDALALFSSITSVLTFLSTFISRYGIREYLHALPQRLIIGLISLFFSFLFLTIAFSSALFIVFSNESDRIRIPIIALSFIPVTLYAKLQLPSLYNMIISTFYPSFLRW